MNKGKSFIVITGKTHPDHKLIKALLGKGYDDILLIYASHWATNSGWTFNNIWLGYTKQEALKEIAIMNIKT